MHRILGLSAMREQVNINTVDGICPATVLRPNGDAPLPAVIFYMDGFGIRPALVDMAERLANAGYLVLLPDLYYRRGPYEPLNPTALFALPNFRELVAPMMASTSNHLAAKDTAAFLTWLDQRTDVAGTQIGTTGYCMGGGMSLTVAGTYPDRIAAAASFHGGNLATDSAMSPHLVASKIRGFAYVAGADRDSSYPPEMADRLEQALTDGNIPHRCEIFADALHGWTMTDFPVYNEAANERHSHELTALFEKTLR